MNQSAKLGLGAILGLIILSSGFVFAIGNWGALQNSFWKMKGAIWGSQNRTLAAGVYVQRSIPKELIRLEQNVNRPVAVNLEEFFRAGTQLELATNFWGFEENQDQNECWFTKVTVIGTLNRSKFSQANSGHIWVFIPKEYLGETIQGNASSSSNYRQLRYQGKPTQVAKVHQGDIVTARAVLEDSTVLGIYTGTDRPIKCGLVGIGDPGELKGTKYPQYPLGTLVVSWPGGFRSLTDAGTAVINIQNNGELYAEINEVAYPDSYGNNLVWVRVEYEIHSPF